MNPPPTTPKIERRGGRRANQTGRPRTFRRLISIRVKEEILERLKPGASTKIRDLVETTFKL
jgi:hypothetical protein